MSNKKREIIFKMVLKIKGCNETFGDFKEPGVIASKIIAYSPKEDDFSKTSMRIALGLLREEEKFIQDIIEVDVKEITECDENCCDCCHSYPSHTAGNPPTTEYKCKYE